MAIATEARNASLQDAVALLTEQAAHKIDVVAPSAALRSTDGYLHIAGIEPVLSDEGVTMVDGIYRPTAVADEGFAARLSLPIGYLRRMRDGDHTDLLDHNVNYWLEQEPSRTHMVRAFKPTAGEPVGIMRALMSDKYKRLDNLDTMLAILSGLRAAGVKVDVRQFDITERRMRFVAEAPEVLAYAPALLKGYRWGGMSADDMPTISAGFAFSNSETGGGALTCTPRLVVQVCKNGLTVTKDVVRNVHLGGRLDEGIVQWSDATQEKSLALVTSQVTDAVTTFLNVEYVERTVAAMEEKAGVRIADPAGAVKVIAKRALFTETEAQGILASFIEGGQVTAGGMVQAVTAYAQQIESPERAVFVEEQAMAVLDLAAALAK